MNRGSFASRTISMLLGVISFTSSPAIIEAGAQSTPEQTRLRTEVQNLGWIAFSAHSAHRDWDLFRCRPDGSQLQNFTRTPEWSEFTPQFSRNGQWLLYRRLPRGEVIDGNHYGTQGELVLTRSDGSEPRTLGKPGEFPWASWNADGTQIACLSMQGIAIISLATLETVRSFPRQGIFQQLTWSPDGRWLSGVANSFGTGWSVIRMDAESGKVSAVNTVDCCTPDWFPDSTALVFSWRPPGQKGNDGLGWTQLWRANLDGSSRELIYAEDGRHVYGGNVSPDGKYVLFSGNVNEDGDPSHSGAPMALMRLADAPLIGGDSPELRASHPKAREGPVLVLPTGYEPCWTFAEIPGATNSLAGEVHSLGWIAYSALSPAGTWDLFISRPDGSEQSPLTRTPDHNEAGVRFSPDSSRLLYYRMPRIEPLDNNTYGNQELVVCDANGENPHSYGKSYPWASWASASNHIAALLPDGIHLIDLSNGELIRKFPRRGIVQQLVASPDGDSFAGTANGLGPFWNIGRLEAGTLQIKAVSETDRYNCTPDWLPDSRRLIYSRGIIPEQGGYAEIWIAERDGSHRSPLVAEEQRHLYGACASPDGHYLLFTRSESDLGKVDNSKTRMAIVRMADTPMLAEDNAGLKKKYPGVPVGACLDLGPGWEPHWTATLKTRTPSSAGSGR